MPITISPDQTNITATNLSATTGSTPLLGGLYSFAVVATWNAGSVALQIQGPDGATFVNVVPLVFTANGASFAYLAAGTYRLAITSATGVDAQLTRQQ